MSRGIASRCAYLALAAALVACGSRPPAGQPELALRLAPGPDSLRLVLLAAPGLKVNARLQPALELDDGTILRFQTTHLTPDSAYFAEPPEARLAARPRPLKGTLRASVCSPRERLCRLVAVAVGPEATVKGQK